jgi:filamin
MYVLLGLCPDWDEWTPKNAKKNAKEAMDAAEKWLDIPQVNIDN